VQTEGQKHWKLGPIVVEHPSSSIHVKHAVPVEFNHHITTIQGSVLYIPPGMWHEAKAEINSIHLTVGIQPPRLVDDVHELVVLAARKHPLLRSGQAFLLNDDGCKYRKSTDLELGLLLNLLKLEIAGGK
jgi:ribosomal protein L16 Arg81 hydroxylase